MLHCFLVLPVVFSLTIYFSRRNVLRLVTLKSKFFNDPWMCLDFLTSYINFSVQMMCIVDLLDKADFYAANTILFLSSFAVFMMWLKVFYWCRLFGRFAYFIKLIIETVIESWPFMKMCFVVLSAYGSFLWVENRSL